MVWICASTDVQPESVFACPSGGKTKRTVTLASSCFWVQRLAKCNPAAGNRRSGRRLIRTTLLVRGRKLANIGYIGFVSPYKGHSTHVLFPLLPVFLLCILVDSIIYAMNDVPPTKAHPLRPLWSHYATLAIALRNTSPSEAPTEGLWNAHTNFFQTQLSDGSLPPGYIC